MGQVKQVQTAVLVPLIYNAENTLCVLFEERAHSLRRQPGEISFPGGHVEVNDKDFIDTALRETAEELCLPRNAIRFVGELDVLLAWSGLVVYPYVGILDVPVPLRPSEAEVDHVFMVPLDHLLAMQPEKYEVALKPDIPDNFPYHLIPNGRNYAWRESVVTHTFYEFENHVVWGLTARILTNFLDILRLEKEQYHEC